MEGAGEACKRSKRSSGDAQLSGRISHQGSTACPEPWKKLAEMLPRRPSCAHLR